MSHVIVSHFRYAYSYKECTTNEGGVKLMNTIFCDPCIITEPTFCKLSIKTDATLDAVDMHCAPDLKEDFATRPIQTVQIGYTPIDEESLHMSFEEAISDRINTLVASGISWNSPKSNSKIIGQHRVIKHTVSNLTASMAKFRGTSQIALSEQSWQHYMNRICLALMFMLMGFDLMGLLILYMH